MRADPAVATRRCRENGYSSVDGRRPDNPACIPASCLGHDRQPTSSVRQPDAAYVMLIGGLGVRDCTSDLARPPISPTSPCVCSPSRKPELPTPRPSSMASKRPRASSPSSAHKRARGAGAASKTITLGTELPPDEDGDDGSFVPVWKQTVTDERGRRRLHGAFTGGFSAG